MMKVIQVFAFAVMLAAVGCEKGEKPETVRAAGPLDILSASAETEVVRVNGKALTVGDVRRRYELERALFDLKHEKGRGRLRPGQLEAARSRFLSQSQRRVMLSLVNDELVKQYLTGKGLGLAVTNGAAYVTKLLNAYRFKGTAAELAQKLGCSEAYLTDQALAPARMEKARDHFAGVVTVSEQEIEEGLERQRVCKAAAIASNKVVRATADAILREIKGGASFEDVAKRDPSGTGAQGELWGIFTAEDFPDAEFDNKKLKDWAFTAEIGSVGGPFDLNDGLAIVKLKARTKGVRERKNLVSAEIPSELTLARIKYDILEENLEPQTREFVQDRLTLFKRAEAQKAFYDELHTHAMKLEYPNGQSFVFKGEQEK